jgi:hypothetical protein
VLFTGWAFENLLYFHLVKLTLIMQPPAGGVQQCLFIGVMVSSQASPTSFSFPPPPKKRPAYENLMV